MQLPLFPLNSVLFPGMPLRLHIFEDRYKEMINECIENKTSFGVVLIESGREAFSSLTETHLYGTTAQITQVQKLPFGRMNILAIGKDRFRINQIDRTTRSFLQANVELLPFQSLTSDTSRLGEYLRPLVQQYLSALERAGQLQFDDSQIPNDNLALAYLSAVVVQTDNEQKQKLLEADNTSDFLQKLIRVYQREIAIIKYLLTEKREDDDEATFSAN